MTSQQGMLDGFDPPRSRAAQIARVLVDVDLPHVDRPLDYVVPDKFIDEAEVGRAVRVRFSGTRVDGWIVERTRRDVLDDTAQIESVIVCNPSADARTVRGCTSHRDAVSRNDLAGPVARYPTPTMRAAKRPSYRHTSRCGHPFKLRLFPKAGHHIVLVTRCFTALQPESLRVQS